MAENKLQKKLIDYLLDFQAFKRTTAMVFIVVVSWLKNRRAVLVRPGGFRRSLDFCQKPQQGFVLY